MHAPERGGRGELPDGVAGVVPLPSAETQRDWDRVVLADWRKERPLNWGCWR